MLAVDFLGRYAAWGLINQAVLNWNKNKKRCTLTDRKKECKMNRWQVEKEKRQKI